jgi:hypothetical protein
MSHYVVLSNGSIAAGYVLHMPALTVKNDRCVATLWIG